MIIQIEELMKQNIIYQKYYLFYACINYILHNCEYLICFKLDFVKI